MVYCCWSYGFTYTFAIFEFDANQSYFHSNETKIKNGNKQQHFQCSFLFFIVFLEGSDGSNPIITNFELLWIS